jgi:hypothetical protein
MPASAADLATRAQLETRAKNAFWKQFQIGIVELIQVAPRCWNGSDAVHYRTEKQMIQRHIEPFYWGGGVALFLFATFRISGSKWYSRVRNRFFANKATMPITASEAQQTQAPGRWKSYLNQKTEQHSGYYDEMLDLPTDVFVSILCGLSTVALLSEPSGIETDVVRAALLPGKSIIYESMCSNMTKAFEDTFDEQIFTGKVDPGVLAFATMVHNCKTRDAYIRGRQNDRKRPDVVPYPGLRAQGQ